MSRQKERRFLQLAVALACLVPISAGTAGVLNGPAMIDGTPSGGMPDLQSHYRYLSGLLLGLGLAFAASIPTIERRSGLFLVLSSVIVIGGLARLSALFTHGMPGSTHPSSFST